MKQIFKFLGWLGFLWCETCGTRLTYWYSHGFNDEKVYRCLNCDKEGGE